MTTASADISCSLEHADGDNRLIARLMLLVIIVGLAWRIVRFAMGFPIWGDEAFVGVSLLVRDFRTMMTPPLEYHQIAPIGFMWWELACVKLLGFSDWSVRIPAFACGLIAFLLFWRFARKLLEPKAALLAVAIMAASFYVVRHSAELKPYAGDMLLSLAVTFLAWSVSRKPKSIVRWAAMAFVGAMGVWLSYPLVFVIAGAGLYLLWTARRQKSWGVLAGSAVFAIVTGASFIIMYVLYTGPQAHHPGNAHYFGANQWAIAFPPLSKPWRLPLWLLDVHTGNMLAYPFGGNHGGSSATTILVIAGVVSFWRSGRKGLLILLLAPLAMTLLAACLKKYPYGYSARTMLFMAPAFCLLAGQGLYVLLGLLKGKAKQWAVPSAVFAMSSAALAFLVVDVIWPFKDVSCYQTRAAVRELAAATGPNDVWVVANALPDVTSPVRKDVDIPVLNGNGNVVFRYYLSTLSPVEVQWGYAPKRLSSSPQPGKTIVFCYTDPDFDAESPAARAARKNRLVPSPATSQPDRRQWQEHFIEDLAARLGEPTSQTFRLDRQDKNDVDTFIHVYIFQDN